MVAIVTGSGLGLDLSSLMGLGARGQLGDSTFGRYGERIAVNAANGNLVIGRTDEILTGTGPSDVVSRSYNSLANSTGYGANNGWQTNDARAVWGLSGTVNTAGSSVYRTDADGSVETYSWNGGLNAYVCTQVGNADNRLTFSSGSNHWTWTDGKTQTQEVYDGANGGRIISATDASGNSLTYTYTGSLLTQVTTADAEYTQLLYSGNNLQEITTHLSGGSTLSRVLFGYDSSNRLTTVTTDLSPTDNSVSDGNKVVTTYGYDGTSNRVNSISQTGGAQLTIAYQLVGSNYCVSSLTQTTATGVTTATSFSYDTVNRVTTITDNGGNVTRLTYDAGGQLTQAQMPPAQSGATAQTVSYTYNSDGDVLTATDPSGNVTTYTYDANDNLLSATDPLGTPVTYTYDANNHVLTRTVGTAAPDQLIAGNESITLCNVGDITTFDPRADIIDASGLTATITAVSSASHGTASIFNGGAAIQYSRTSLGTDTFTYTVTDSLGNTGTATVTVADSNSSANQAPIVGNTTNVVAGVGTSWTFDPRANASDVNGYAMTITGVSTPSYGTATINSGGTAITYTRTGSGTDTFTYTISDGHGHSATATATLNDVTVVNQAPTAGNISAQVSGIGTAFTFDPRAYASDANLYAMTITAVSSPTHGTASIVNSGTAITYTRTGNGSDSFTFTLSDGHGRTATATASMSDIPGPINSPPVAYSGSTKAFAGETATVDMRAVCSDVNNYPLTVTSVTQPSKGTVTINADGSLTYHCNTSGNDSYTYTISDGHGRTATGTISISSGIPTGSQVMAANNDTVSCFGVGNNVTFDPRANDYNLYNRSITISSTTTPSHGTVSILGGGTSLKYTRTGAGNDTFTYTISDGQGNSATATVTVYDGVTASQHVVATNDTIAVNPGNSLTFDPRVNDANYLNYGMTITAVSTPSGGTASIVNSGTAIQYNRSGSGPDSFTYTISDGHGGTATATVTVANAASPQIVTATNDALVVNAVGDTSTFNPLLNDANLYALPMTITSVSSPTHGTATITNSGTEIAYTRTSAGADSFTYTISDGNGHTATATISVTGSTSGGTVNPISGQIETERFAYDTNGNLRFAVNGDGQVGEYRYNGYGQQTSAITYTNNAYNLTGLSSTTALSLSTMTSWVAGISDLSTIKRVDTTYDFRGNVATVTSYSACDTTTGAGLTTQPTTVVIYVYDPSGKLLSRQTSGISNTEVFHYDGLWRTTYAVDLNAGTTTIQYNDSQNNSVVTLANGLIQTSTYDLAGRLITSTMSGTNLTTATTAYKFDSLGNLALVTDATGRSSYFLFDTVGRKVASIAADGSIVEYRYDANNRLVATIAYATKLNSTQLSSLVDGNGNPTDPALSTVRPSSNSADAWTWQVYDKDNRLIETIDGNGDATVLAYDTFSNVVSTTSYANAIAAATVTGFHTTLPTALQLPTSNPAADEVTRRFYDNEGRLIGSLDANGFLSQITYNNAGEKIETIAYATATSAGLWVTGTFAQLLASAGTSAADIHTRDFYDDRGLLRYTLDANLRPAEYDYDNAGNLISKIEYAGPIASTSAYTLAYVQSQISSSGLATNAGNRSSWWVYDSATGNLDYAIDAVGEVTQFRYDSLGLAIKQTQFATLDPVTACPSQATMDSWAGAHATASDRITRTVYDLAGRAVYTVDGESYVTEYRYDAAGRTTLQIRYADPYSVTDSVTQASLQAELPSTIPSSAVQTSFSYDSDGRVTDTYNGLGTDTHVVYDALGRVTDSTVAYGTSDASTTHFTYDVANRVLTETRAYGQSESATTSYAYDGQGHVLSATDPDGNATTFTYDALGHLLTTKDPLNAITTNTYDSFGNLQTTTDALGNKSYYFYDLLGRLTLEIDRMGYATATSYTIGNEIASVTHYATAVTGTITPGTPPTLTTNSQDATTSFTRDLLGRVTQTTDAEGYHEQYTLNAFGDRLTVTNKLGGVTTNSFDHRGLLLSEILPESSVRADGTTQATSVTNTYLYDSRGNRTRMVEASGLTEQRTTNYSYDKLDRLVQSSGDAVQVTATDLQTVSTVTPTTTYIYDNRGNVIETDDATGARTLAYYDHLGRRVAGVNALGTLSAMTYDANGNVLTSKVYGDAVSLPSTPGGTPPSPVNSSNCRLTSYTYDKDNRLLTATVASLLTGDTSTAYATTTGNVTVTNTYDALGDLVRQMDGRGNSVWTYYDKSARKIAQVDQANYLTAWTLDSNGNVLTETRYATQLSSTPTVSSNPATLASSIGSSANDRITTFTYDRNGNRLTEARQNVVSNTVNATTGALTQTTGQATITYTYNGLGEVTRKTEATGDYTAYSYDGAGRQTQIQLSSFTDWTGATVQTTTSEAYDGLNNLTRTSKFDALNGATTARVTTYAYGAGGRLSAMTDASGFARNYFYDAAGRTVKVSYTRFLSDGVTQATEADAFRYDALGRQTFQSVATWGGTNWAFGDQYQTQYDVYGEVTARGANGMWQQTYSYDSAGRLWSSTADDGTVKMYIYDQSGNRSLEIDSSGVALPTGYSWSTLTLSQAIAILTNNGANAIGGIDSTANGMVVTITTHDGRGQALSTMKPFRQLSTNGTGGYNTATLTTSNGYNAFGEAISQTDANGNVSNFTYSTLGKVLQQQLPSVNYTAENGAIQSAHPTTTYYYDLSGRVVGVLDANGNLNTRILLANTGYGGADPSVVKEFHPDSSTANNKFDVFGDKRQSINGLGSVESYTYDAMDRLTAQAHATRPANSIGNPTGSAVTLTDNYAYDGLGQRTQHWNSQLGSSVKETTDYDSEGRIVNQVDFGGHATAISYSWSGSYATTGLGTFGGWFKSTYLPSQHTVSEATDFFGRTLTKVDDANVTFAYSYDLAGRLVTRTNNDSDGGFDSTGETVTYSYYNTGLIASADSEYDTTVTIHTQGDGDFYDYSQRDIIGAYKYDANGNRTFESTTDQTFSDYQQTTTTFSRESSTVTWDSLNRMTSLNDTGNSATTAVSMNWEYDLNSNVRHIGATYYTLDSGGNAATLSSQDDWFKFDSMNRFVTVNGEFVGTRGSGSIDRGANGSDIAYDAAGNRATAATTLITNNSGTYSFQEQKEFYTYTADGYLAQTNVALGTASTSSSSTYIQPAAASGPGTLQATYLRDAMGRVSTQSEYDSTGTNVVYSKLATYDNVSNVLTDQVTTVRSDGSGTFVQSDTYDYLAYNWSTGLYTGPYQNGEVTHFRTTLTKNGSSQPTTDTVNTWRNSAQQATIAYKPDINGSTTYTTTYTYDARGTLKNVDIEDGSPRTIKVFENFDGEILQSENTAGPQTLNYFFNDQQVAQTTNDGTGNITYAQSIAQQTAKPGTGFYVNGSTSPTQYADFGTQYEQINGMNTQGAAQSYTVQQGDTLQSIAASIWGDSNFWYLIADANGLTSASTLQAGETLSIPNKIANDANNSSTFTPYNPNQTIGDTSPTHPPKQSHGGCGIFGQILEAIVAVAVTIFLGPLAGDIAKQIVALADGDQRSFSWKEVGVTAATEFLLGPAPGIGGSLIQNIAYAVAYNAVNQGLSVATGLQKNFDWVGLAAAAVTAGVAHEVQLNSPFGDSTGDIDLGSVKLNGLGSTFVSSMAGGLAGAATRSLIRGTDFGDNLIRTLPDVIGQTIGNTIIDGLQDDPAKDELHSAFDRAQSSDAGTEGMSQVADASGQYGTAPKSEDILGWLGDKLETGLQWVGREVDQVVVDPVEGFLGLSPDSPIAPAGKPGGPETVYVTAHRPGPFERLFTGLGDSVSSIFRATDRVISDTYSNPIVHWYLTGDTGIRTTNLVGPPPNSGVFAFAPGPTDALTNPAYQHNVSPAELVGNIAPLVPLASALAPEFKVAAVAGGLEIDAEAGAPVTQTIGDLRSLGLKDAHHVIQDAAVRDLPGYDSQLAPGVHLEGPSTLEGSAHYNATQAQRVSGGGTYGDERLIAYDSLRAAGYTDAQATQAVQEADTYFNSIGVTVGTPTRIPGNRPR